MFITIEIFYIKPSYQHLNQTATMQQNMDINTEMQRDKDVSLIRFLYSFCIQNRILICDISVCHKIHFRDCKVEAVY